MFAPRPRLLVSVFHAAEVEAALAGGADIVDVKNPVVGALGAPTPDVLRAVVAAVAGRVPVSAALGDGPHSPGALALAAAGAAACGAAYVKLGLVGSARPEAAIALLAALRSGAGAARIVAVAFADAASVGGLPAAELPAVASAAGADLAMLDTATKNGASSFDLLGEAGVRAFVAATRGRGLGVALAGALRPEDADRARDLDVDVVGVRGAACEGGRGGVVSAARVRGLRERLSLGGVGAPLSASR